MSSRASRLIPPIQQLIDKRMSTLGTRLRVRERRTALRSKREKLIDMDAQFSQALRNLAAQSRDTELTALLTEYEARHDYREEVQVQESEYNVLEDELNRSEWEMKEDESGLYQQLIKAQRQLRNQDTGSLSDGDDDYVVLSSSTISAPSIGSPIRQRWLSRIGDRDLLKDQLLELREDRARWVDEKMVRQRVGLGLPEEGQSFLNDFDKRHDSLQLDLTEVEADVSNLYTAVLEQDDILYSSCQFDDKFRTASQSSSESRLEMGDDPPESPPADSLYIREDSETVSPPGFFNGYLFKDPKHGSITTVNYINAWLLHILRGSALEILRFKMSGSLRTPPLNPRQLKDLVLEWWSRDATVSRSPQARDQSAPSVSISSRAQEERSNNKTQSDTVVFESDRIARRLQGSQSIRLDGAPSLAISRLPKVLNRPFNRTSSSV